MLTIFDCCCRMSLISFKILDARLLDQNISQVFATFYVCISRHVTVTESLSIYISFSAKILIPVISASIIMVIVLVVALYFNLKGEAKTCIF